MIKLLVEAGADVNAAITPPDSLATTPLRIAITKRRPEAALELLSLQRGCLS